MAESDCTVTVIVVFTANHEYLDYGIILTRSKQTIAITMTEGIRAAQVRLL